MKNAAITLMYVTSFAIAFFTMWFVNLIHNPEHFGNAMKRFDNARYETVNDD